MGEKKKVIISAEIMHNKGKIVYRDRLTKNGYKIKTGVHLYRHKGMYLGTAIDRIRMIACFQMEGKEWRWDYQGLTAKERKRGTVARASRFDIEVIDEVMAAIGMLRVEAFGKIQEDEAAPKIIMSADDKAKKLGF